MPKSVRFSAAVALVLALVWTLTTNEITLAGDSDPQSKAPRVVQVYPSDGMQHVPVDTAIHIVFSESMDEASAMRAVTISPAPELAFPASWQFLNNKTIMVVIPAKPLRYSTTYRITVSGSARDSQGTEMGQDYSWSFTTTKSPPAPVAVPANGGFAAGGLAGWSWSHSEAAGSRAASWSVVADGQREHVLRITRPPTFEMGSCAIEQRIDAEVPASGLVFLSFDLRLDDYTLKEYTTASTYPLKVILTYLDRNRVEHSFVKAYYFHLPSEGGIDSFAEFVELGRWTSRSYNLSVLVPRPVVLKSLRFECSGWAWTTLLDDVKLVW
ncbi:MAG: Ig-like domain-containing protein [Firmicutes bacterium]|jgi:hypothetical protein|nr:Ig-like domain-containing protein [Bacillota bacterium]MDH7494883.1 Ig-like domain-containing protein [Bacillota bacterium]